MDALTPDEEKQLAIDLRMGRMLYAWRRAVHLDLVEASELTGIPAIRIAALEKGRAPIPIRKTECKNFATAYGINPNTVERIALGDTPPSNPPEGAA